MQLLQSGEGGGSAELTDHKLRVKKSEEAESKYAAAREEWESRREIYDAYQRLLQAKATKAAQGKVSAAGARTALREVLRVVSRLDSIAAVFSPYDPEAQAAITGRRAGGGADSGTDGATGSFSESKDDEAGAASGSGGDTGGSGKKATKKSSKQTDDQAAVTARRPKYAMSPDEAMDLEEPFGIMARGETFTMLGQLLNAVLPIVRGHPEAKPKMPKALDAEEGAAGGQDASMEEVVLCACTQLSLRLLHLVRANIERLQQAHVDPSEAGIRTSGPRASLLLLNQSLNQILSNDSAYPPVLQRAAVETTRVGLEVLHGTAE